MNRPERLLVLSGIAIIASAILLVTYVAHSNAESQSGNCAVPEAHLETALDQVRFATSAQRAVASALEYSDRSRRAYYKQITSMRGELAYASPAVQKDLVQASVILSEQEQPIDQAQAIAAEAKQELGSGVPLVSQASTDLDNGDCGALSLTMARSGWPKDHLLDQLALAAHLNSSVSDRLDAALALIVAAQQSRQAR